MSKPIPNTCSGAAADSDHRMSRNENKVTQELSSCSPMAIVNWMNWAMSSEMRWSGLSAASPKSCMR